MAKALVVVGGIAIVTALVAYPAGAVVVLAVPLAVGLGLVWWLTDSSVDVGRAQKGTWFDKAAEVGGWEDADDVAASPAPIDEPTARVVVRGASRADPRRV